MRTLTYEELPSLYEHHMKRDFPPSELRPLRSMEILTKKNYYQCWGLFEEEELMAYAGFLGEEKAHATVLDYFAVVPQYRNKGLGGVFLQQVAEHQPNAGFLLECEEPSKGKTPEERQLRARRIGFYLRQGAQLTPVGWRVATVDYVILWFPLSQKEQPTPEIILQDLTTCYSHQWNPIQRKLVLKGYSVDPEKVLAIE